MSADQHGLRISDLVGKQVEVVFTMPEHLWPIQGTPAFCLLRGVDSGMVCLSERWAPPGADAHWYSLNIIQSIREA